MSSKQPSKPVLRTAYAAIAALCVCVAMSSWLRTANETSRVHDDDAESARGVPDGFVGIDGGETDAAAILPVAASLDGSFPPYGGSWAGIDDAQDGEGIGRPADPLLLPFEAALLAGRTPTAGNEDELMSLALSAELPADLYAAESMVDPDARAQSELFGRLAREAAASINDRVEVQGLVCGIRLCLGTVQAETELDYTLWSDAFFLRPAFSGISLQSTAHRSENGMTTVRFGYWLK
jgi:hypothetical protein